MGDPKRCRKKWHGPRHPWRKEILAQELQLLGLYGLRNKKELWIAKTILRKFRRQARSLLALPPERRAILERQLISKLYNMGLLLSENATIDDVLGIKVEDVLERRLQTIVYRKGFARTPYQARQFVVHGHVLINGRRVTSPGYLVSRDEEDQIQVTIAAR
ncbi:MAG: 30S ribosomal protein S4 [Candidatus Methanomethylicota archaeon]|uniref:Small ribosomal subunit protein uS4 n=1 Tax=Thermoproteota archaeon TaxID=2056631 RepID=A0A497EZN2_9CREN|nr:MAG: 30S ribosomal protein S4 [Candidatus Verstraetearchaeota archaeon]RLE52471.1 MAG: 30S ribosomal protein S4 [Candidatus Verstraetearchaeota archaeon]